MGNNVFVNLMFYISFFLLLLGGTDKIVFYLWIFVYQTRYNMKNRRHLTQKTSYKRLEETKSGKGEKRVNPKISYYRKEI